MAMENTTEYLWQPADISRRVQLLCRILPNKKMDETRLKKLLEMADDQDQVKLKVLYNAVIKGVNEYNKNSAQAKLKNWKSAEKELDAYIDKLWSKYIDDERTFPNLLAVIDYLQEKNWKIGKSRAYEHHKEGKIQPETNGTYRLSHVEKYAATHLKRADGKTASNELEKYATEKARIELENEKEKLEQIRHKNKLAAGAYVPREMFEQELAKRAAVFKSDIENYIRGGAEKIIALVEGNPMKTPALIEHQLDTAADWLNRYSRDKEIKPMEPAAVTRAQQDENLNEEEDED